MDVCCCAVAAVVDELQSEVEVPPRLSYLAPDIHPRTPLHRLAPIPYHIIHVIYVCHRATRDGQSNPEVCALPCLPPFIFFRRRGRLQLVACCADGRPIHGQQYTPHAAAGKPGSHHNYERARIRITAEEHPGSTSTSTSSRSRYVSERCTSATPWAEAVDAADAHRAVVGGHSRDGAQLLWLRRGARQRLEHGEVNIIIRREVVWNGGCCC